MCESSQTVRIHGSSILFEQCTRNLLKSDESSTRSSESAKWHCVLRERHTFLNNGGQHIRRVEATMSLMQEVGIMFK